MKQFFILTFLCSGLFAARNGFSQHQFAPDSAVWHHAYQEWQFWPGPDDSRLYNLETTVMGDTLFQGKNCRSLKRTLHSPTGPSSVFDTLISWQDTFKIYYWNKYQLAFNLGYDFGARAGDTLHLNYCETIVDTVGIEVFGGDSLRFYTTRDAFLSGRFYEKIGYQFGLFPWYACVSCPTGYVEWALYCYEDPQIGFYSTGWAPTCNYVLLDIENKMSQSPPKIFTLENQWTIQVDASQKISEISLYNLSGKLEFHSLPNPDHRMEIPNSSLSTGIYLFRGQLISGEIFSGKLLKQ